MIIHKSYEWELSDIEPGRLICIAYEEDGNDYSEHGMIVQVDSLDVGPQDKYSVATFKDGRMMTDCLNAEALCAWLTEMNVEMIPRDYLDVDDIGNE